ncbi:hypothetical protein KI387_021320, partial [Taxus chinensis]
MEEEYIPVWLAAVMAKNWAEYEQFKQKVQAKHQDFMQWMQASHEELMQKTMQQIAMAHTHYNTTTITMMKETHKRDNLTHDASANTTVDTKGHSSTDTENSKNLGVEKAEIDTGPSSGPFRGASLFGAHTGSSCSTCFGNSSIGSASSQSVGVSWMPVIGSSSAPVGKIGQSSSCAFGNTSLFGTETGCSSCGISFGSANLFGTETGSSSCSSPFGRTCLFGSHTESSCCSSTAYSVPAFGGTSMPTCGISTFGQKPFGAISTSACGSISTPVSGTRTPIFGAMNAHVYGFPSAPATGAPRPTIGSGSTHAVGQSNAAFSQSAAAFSGSSTPTFGSSLAFESTVSTFGSQSSALGTQSITPIFSSLRFGQTSSGRLHGTCWLAPYTSTPETDSGVSGQAIGELISICAMPQYKAESHEELRWEDYQLGNKGHSNPASQQISWGNIYFQPAPSLGETTHSFETKFRLGLDRPVSALDSYAGKKIVKYSARLGKFKKRTSTFGKNPSSGGCESPTTTQSNPSRSNFGQTEPAFGTQPAFGAANTSAFGFPLTPAFGTTTTSFGLTNAPFNLLLVQLAYQHLVIPVLRLDFVALLLLVYRLLLLEQPQLQHLAAAQHLEKLNQQLQLSSVKVLGKYLLVGYVEVGLTPYTTTKEADCGSWQTLGILISISAMPQFIDESHEELRWADYQLGNK